MADGDPRVRNAMFLDHLAAGIAELENVRLSEADRVEATRLAWRLAALSVLRDR